MYSYAIVACGPIWFYIACLSGAYPKDALLAVGKITKRSVDAIVKPADASGRAYLWDTKLKGFGVMVTHKDVRSYLVQYRIGGRGSKTRRETIGQHGNPWTAELASDRAAELLEQVRRGIDPFEAKRERLANEREGRADATRFAFSAVADSFVKSCRARKLRSADDIDAVFRRDLKPCFLNKPLPSIRRTDVHDCLAKIGERSPSSANKAHSWLHAMFAWSVDQGRYGLAASPMADMSPPFGTVKRKRVLRGAELAMVWNASTALGDPFGIMAQLLLLTGQRLREVAEMRWEEIDLAATTWRIPGDRTKNKLDHLCPLSAGTIGLLKSVQPEARLRKGVVLTTTGDKSVAGFSKAKRKLDALIVEQAAKVVAETGGGPVALAAWTFHDLRRSLATGLQALGFPVEHTEAVINHVSGKRGGIVGVYQLHEYWNEKVAALAAWDRHVSGLLSNEPQGSNVVTLKRA